MVLAILVFFFFFFICRLALVKTDCTEKKPKAASNNKNQVLFLFFYLSYKNPSNQKSDSSIPISYFCNLTVRMYSISSLFKIYC